MSDEGRIPAISQQIEELMKSLDVREIETDDGHGLHSVDTVSPYAVRQLLVRLVADLTRLRSVCEESNAVCMCGCPPSAHESLGEDGESCGHDDHQCVRTSRTVLAELVRLRAAQQASKS